MHSKILSFIAVLVVLIGGVLYMQVSDPGNIPLPEYVPDTAKEAAPVATGKVDDILASLGSEDAQEESFRQTGDADAETVLSDEGVISDLNQSYDETAL